jgi:rod shape-determining protein MreC
MLQAMADPDCKIATISTRSNNPGIVYSPDGARILIEYAVTSDIKLGDSLVTWGAGGTFPRGLPVGRVAEIIKSPANLMKSARIVPFQNPWMVEDVFVLLRAPILKVGGDLPPDSIEVDTTRVEKK